MALVRNDDDDDDAAAEAAGEEDKERRRRSSGSRSAARPERLDPALEHQLQRALALSLKASEDGSSEGAEQALGGVKRRRRAVAAAKVEEEEVWEPVPAYQGVERNEVTGTYRCSVRRGGKAQTFGTYATLTEAAAQADELARKLGKPANFAAADEALPLFGAALPWLPPKAPPFRVRPPTRREAELESQLRAPPKAQPAVVEKPPPAKKRKKPARKRIAHFARVKLDDDSDADLFRDDLDDHDDDVVINGGTDDGDDDDDDDDGGQEQQRVVKEEEEDEPSSSSRQAGGEEDEDDEDENVVEVEEDLLMRPKNGMALRIHQRTSPPSSRTYSSFFF